MEANELNHSLNTPSCDCAGIASSADYEYCRQVMRSASRNYAFASALLPEEQLRHVEALYAFLRVGDDRVDVSHAGFASPLAAIDDWEALYWRAFKNGDSPHPVMRAYLATAYQHCIPVDLMSSYFKAMRQDLTTTRYPTFQDLLGYMEGSAMSVGRAMTYILKIQPHFTFAEVLPRADALSIAMQLSNFWRDIGYDWSIGRVYIPQEDLARFGVSEEDIAARRLTPQWINLLEFEIQRTEGYYQVARLGVPMLASGQWGVMCGLEVYRSILTDIRRPRAGRPYDVFSRRAGPSKARKLILAGWAWWNTRTL